MMKRLSLPSWLAPMAALLVLAAVVYFEQSRRAELAGIPRLACADPAQGCDARLGNTPLRLGMDAHRRPMQPFHLWVQAPGARRVVATFTMEDMDMGLNQYTLQADKQGIHRARVTLPVCVTGRADWLLTLEVDGERLQLPFVIGL